MNPKKKRAQLIEAAKAIRDKVTAEDRPMTDEEVVEIESKLSEAKELETQIAKFEKASNISKQIDDAMGTINKDEPKSLETAVISGIRDRVEDDPMRGFKHMGEFAVAVHSAHPEIHGGYDKRLNVLAAASGNQQAIGSDGGFLVPPQFSNQIWDGLNKEPDNLINGTTQFTLDQGDSITIPANAETSRATGSRFGGVQGFWISEAKKIATSKPTFRQVKLEPQELAVLVFATNKLLKNSPTAVDQYLTRAAIQEINFLSSDAIINGTGAGQPLGVLNGDGIISIAKESGQAKETIVAENIDKMWARLHPRARARAEWLVNVDVEPQLEKLTQDIGTGGVALFRPGGSIANVPFNTLKGRPIRPVEYCATLGTVGDIILIDLGFYTTAMMGGIDSAMSTHLRFDFAEAAFRFMFSIDGQPWIQTPLTPFKGTNTQSAYLTLANRA